MIYKDQHDIDLRRVTIGYITGKEKSGLLYPFSPYIATITLKTDIAPGEVQDKNIAVDILQKDLAYIAFHRSEDKTASDESRIKLEAIKIRLIGGMSFTVRARIPETSNKVGFYGFPIEQNHKYDKIFFFSHAITVRESSETIGELLIKEGLITEEDLKNSITEQTSERSKRIGDILAEKHNIEQKTIDKFVSRQRRKQLRLGELLVEAGLVSSDDVDVALKEQKERHGKRLGQILIEKNILNEIELAVVLAKKFHLPFVDLRDYPINPDAVKEVPPTIIKKYEILPVNSDKESLTVAISDPLSTEGIDLLNFNSGKRINEVIVTPSQIKLYIDSLNNIAGDGSASASSNRKTIHSILEELNSSDTYSDTQNNPVRDDTHQLKETDKGIIRLFNEILLDAYDRGASDIHIEPNGNDYSTRIRFRIDGICSIYQDLPPIYWRPLVNRIKVMANMDISEKRKPQDGKIRFLIPDRQIELRVVSVPTANGNEDVVLRVLSESKPKPLDSLKIDIRNLREIKRLINLPYGLFLVVGPTGSGKTTTLHSALSFINKNDRKIWTAEDPVEITQPGLRQVQINPKIDFNFASALRSFLRADPDVIMVGEMRDSETAKIGVEAALTGHMVFSTLHTNSAPETVTRLLDMGLEPFSFGDALLGVLAQRLTRALCTSCREQYPATLKEYNEIAQAYGEEDFKKQFGAYEENAFLLWRSQGCKLCGNTGFKGRVALHELLVADNDEVHEAIQRKFSVSELRHIGKKNGMTTLLQDGIEKSLQGLTNMSQVLAVCLR